MFIAPGVGTMLGATMGSFLGAFSLSPEKKREVLYEKLKPEIDQLYKQLETQLAETFDNCKDMAYYLIEQKIDSYAYRYKSRVNAIDALQQRDFRHFQLRIYSYLQQSKRHVETLQKLLQSL